MKSTVPSVNLLNFQHRDIATQFVDWALTIGRLLVIITEAVAFTMFAYRFIIDRQIVDIHEYIKQRQPYLVIEAPREKTFRDIQDRLQLTTAHAGDTMTAQATVIRFVSDAQSLVTFQDLKISGTKVSLDAKATTISSLKRFIDKLRAEPNINTVAVEKIDSDPTTNTITFSVAVTQKK